MREKWLALLAVVGALVLGAWGLGQRGMATRTQAAMEAGYQRDFFDLINQVEQIQVLLSKALVSGSERHNISQLTEIWMRANTAQSDLSHLPLKDVNLSASRKFLSQLGDYAYRLAQANARGNPISDKDWDRLQTFQRQTARFSSTLHAVQLSMARSGFRWSDVAPRRPGAAKKTAPRAPRTAAQTAGAGALDGFTAADKRLQQLPALIYDGPFSDHLEKRRPLGLTGEPVDEARATRIATDAAGRGQSVGRPRLTQGRLPTFSVTLRDGRNPAPIVVDVSRQGGHIVQMNDARPIGTPRIGSDEARKRAADWLAAHGLPGMTPTFTARVNNSEVITFVYRQMDTLIYPDQVKVKVALDNGQVTGLDAVSYFTNHRERDLPRPRLTPEEARAKVNRRLRVDNVQLSLIPTESAKEILAYEVRARLGRDTYLIYINALTGEEENILKLVDTPNGKLVM